MYPRIDEGNPALKSWGDG